MKRVLYLAMLATSSFLLAQQRPQVFDSSERQTRIQIEQAPPKGMTSQQWTQIQALQEQMAITGNNIKSMQTPQDLQSVLKQQQQHLQALSDLIPQTNITNIDPYAMNTQQILDMEKQMYDEFLKNLKGG